MLKSILRFFGFLVVLLLAAGLLVWLNFDWVRFNGVIWMSTPSEPFDKTQPPPAFDYAIESAWAALPTRRDFADDVVEGEFDGQPTAAVDVFFVHGTTYFQLNKGRWNQPPEDQTANGFTDLTMHGASMFNACCKVYAPRFRQASLGSFADTTGSGIKAHDLAYKDVEVAFDYFLEHYNTGRPFILAGYSQGSEHVFRLIKSRISGTPLAERMVAAYPLVFWEPKERFAKDSPGVPICSSRSQVGCVATFNPVGPNLRTGLLPLFDQQGLICVNPLTWRADNRYGGFELNIGSRTFKSPNKLLPGLADAKCDRDGRLLVSNIRTDVYEGVPVAISLLMNLFGRENYHSIAGGLFYGNIRRNAKDRVDAYLAAHQAVEPVVPH